MLHTTPSPGRDPVAIVDATNVERVPELIPYRFGRMAIVAVRLLPWRRGHHGRGPRRHAGHGAARPGLRRRPRQQLRRVRDARATRSSSTSTTSTRRCPGAWEWDVKRLAASIDLVARARYRRPGGASRDRLARRPRVPRTHARIRRALDAGHAGTPSITDRRRRGALPEALPDAGRPAPRRGHRARRTARGREAHRAWCDGHRRFVESVRRSSSGSTTPASTWTRPRERVDGYRASLSDDRRTVFDRFELVDVARKAVGVGSVGTYCWVALFEGPEHPDGDFIVLQIKEAGPSVLEPTWARRRCRITACAWSPASGSPSRPATGSWAGPRGRVTGRHYYVRQLWDIEGLGRPGSSWTPSASPATARCARGLSPARTRAPGDAVVISGYLGTGRAFDDAIADFAAAYADQAERDHAALMEAIATGRVEATTEG